MNVYVMHYEHKHGDETSVYATRALAVAARDEIADEWWEREFPDTPKPTENIGDEYFNRIEYEWCSITEREITEDHTLETPRMLVLSTSHITKETDSNFENNTDDVPTFYPKTYWDGEKVGYIIPLVRDYPWSHMISADLVAIRKVAEAAGCTWIMLDRDGEQIEGLPTYDW